MGSVEFRLLGAVEVWRAGRAVPLGGPRQRAVLAALLLRANESVSVSQLREAVWEDPPVAAESNVRTYLARLRRELREPGGESRLITRHGGYELVVHPGELDWAAFDELAGRGRRAAEAGDFGAAAGCFDRALRLWRGRPLDGLKPGPGLRAELTRLWERYLTVVEQRARAGIELGEHEVVVGDLRRFVAEHPAREELSSLLMLALYRCGRQAEALDVLAGTRQHLVTEFGVEPGAGLRTMQQRILTADPTLDAVGPGPRGPVSAHRQLPMDISDFTGREADLARLRRLVDRAGERSVVITAVDGMAGVGKTRLAVHAAHQLVRAGRFDELQLWADLRGFDPDSPPADPAGVLEAFLGLLGVAPRQIPAELAARAALYRDRLAGRKALVLLDNAANEAQVQPLLPGSPGCLVLVTSRRTLADLDGAGRLHLDVPSAEEAAALLGRIAGDRRVAAQPAEARRVADLCGRLPIAITLAAQRLRNRPTWTVKDLAGRLEAAAGRLDELHGRNRAVRAAFDLSYRTLPDAWRRVFRLIGLHPGDTFAADSVAALAGTPPRVVEDILESLLDEHLLQEVTPGRYRPHDLLRLYARERALAEEPDADAALRRLFLWYLHAAENAAGWLDPEHRPVPLGDAPPWLPDFGTRARALDWCEVERANLVDVVRAAAERGEHGVAWQLPCALLSFYYLRKHWDDWISTHRVAVDAAVRAGERGAQARVLNGLGVAYSDLGRHDEAVSCHREASPLFRAAGDTRGEAWNLNNLGVAYHDLQRFEEAAGCHRKALPLMRAIHDAHGESICLNNLGDAHRRLGQLAQAADCLNQALDIQRRTGDRAAQRFTLWTFGALHQDTGMIAEAVASYRQALEISRNLNDRWNVANLLTRLADALDTAGHPTEAHDCRQEAHTILAQLADPDPDPTRPPNHHPTTTPKTGAASPG